ncbi:hypothetical protein [Paraburkholderia sp. EG304]|uniref:hypothetical protein n=1 Tax=Paraburkholderia sp. EG304 TaxID=3237015 RepID=UPI00397807C0
MKMPQIKPGAFAFVVFIALEAACRVGLAASSTERVAAAADESVTANLDFRGTRPMDVDGRLLTLTLRSPSGGTSRLTYVSEDGWSLEDQAAPLKQGEARIASASTQGKQEVSGSERPLTVFIDGPTGFTYVWLADQGWKFVGRLSDRNR